LLSVVLSVALSKLRAKPQMRCAVAHLLFVTKTIVTKTIVAKISQAEPGRSYALRSEVRGQIAEVGTCVERVLLLQSDL
jgi:hypothetical protein